MFAVKANVEYSITETEKKKFIELGYDIYDENGKKISEGANKKVSAKQYSDLKKKYDDLNKTMEEKDAEIAELNKKLAEKDAEIAELNKKLAEKDAEIKKQTKKETKEEKNTDENNKK